MNMSMSALTKYLKDYISFHIVILKHSDKLVSFLHLLSNVKGLIFELMTQ